MRLAIGIVLVFLAFSALFGATARAESERAAPTIRFYRAESPQGRVTFFYPSFHLRDSRVPRPPMAMLDRVQRLVLEADILAAKAHPEALTPYILSPRPLELAKFFTPREIAGIRSRADCNGMGPLVEKLRLSFIATMVALPCPKPGGGSYEEQVEEAAKQRRLVVTGLESAEEEFKAMATLPDRFFIAEIKEFAVHPEREERMMARMIALYNAGDLDGLHALAEKSGFPKAADSQVFAEKILIERNRRMVERMADVLAEGGALVVVGALHFPGKDGIIDLLTRRGFTVRALSVTDGVLR